LAELSADGTAAIFLWQYPGKPVAVGLSCQDREVFEYIIDAMHLYAGPLLSRIFLRTGEVRSALNTLARSGMAGSIRVREVVYKSLIDDPQSVKRVRTNREWTDEDYAVIFDKLGEDKGWLSSLKIEVHGSALAFGRIWRDSTFACEHGYQFFSNTVLPSLVAAVMDSQRFFENRGRSSTPNGQSRPIRIVYGQNVFSDKRQNHRLIAVLRQLKEAGLSVIHPNPYLHAAILDYADGSSYDIWVTTPTSIVILPKRKASVHSIARLCNHICEEFEEGDVTEFSGS
jgi:hypothetical protein